MKTRIAVCLAMVLFSASSYGQALKESEVPVGIKTVFSEKFPDAKKVKWSKESETEYEAEFKRGTLSQAANFDSAGKWIATETEIKPSSLPPSVKAVIAQDFIGFGIEESEKVETPDKGTFYEVTVEKGKLAYNLEISVNGDVLSKVEMKKEGNTP